MGRKRKVRYLCEGDAMTNKEKIKYLSQYTKLVVEYKHIYNSFEALKFNLQYPAVSAQKLSVIPGGGGGGGNPIEAEYFRLVSLEELIGDIVGKMQGIEKSINALEDSSHRTVLRLRYLDGMKWEKICVAISYEWAWTHRIHSNALGKIQICKFF